MICKDLDMMREKGITEVTYEKLKKFSEEINNHIKNCKECQPERLNPEDHIVDLNEMVIKQLYMAWQN